jgi:hypothetical protein
MKNTPAYHAYHIKDINAGENSDKHGIWTKISAAWPNKDGKGFSVQLDLLPPDGRLILREPLPENDSAVDMPLSEG